MILFFQTNNLNTSKKRIIFSFFTLVWFLSALSAADLSIRVSLPKALGRVGDTIVCDVQIRNDGRSLIEKSTVQVSYTDALQIVSHTVDKGSFDRGSGVWFFQDMTATDGYVTLKITYVLVGSGPSAVTGEITTCSQPDTDSKPANGAITEDDLSFGTITVPIVVCGNLPIDITAYALPGFKKYQWKRNEMIMNGENDQSLRIREPGNYSYLIMDDEKLSAFSAPIIVERGDYPQVSLGEDITIVAGSEELFVKPDVAGGLPPYRYKWSNDIKWDMKRPLKKGQTMQLKVKVTDRRGCISADAVNVAVK